MMVKARRALFMTEGNPKGVVEGIKIDQRSKVSFLHFQDFEE